MSGSHLSKDFFELIKNIGECKSKQEEDKVRAPLRSYLSCAVHNCVQTCGGAFARCLSRLSRA